MKKGLVCSFLAALKTKNKKHAKQWLETIAVLSVAHTSGLPGLSWAAVAGGVGGCLTGSGQVVAEAAVISGAFSFMCPVPGMEASDPRVSARGGPGRSDFSRGGGVVAGSQPQRPGRTNRSLWPLLTRHGGPTAPDPWCSQRPGGKGEGRGLRVLLGRV